MQIKFFVKYYHFKEIFSQYDLTLNFEYLSNGFAVENPVNVAATDLIIYSDAFCCHGLKP